MLYVPSEMGERVKKFQKWHLGNLLVRHVNDNVRYDRRADNADTMQSTVSMTSQWILKYRPDWVQRGLGALFASVFILSYIFLLAINFFKKQNYVGSSNHRTLASCKLVKIPLPFKLSNISFIYYL